MQGEGGDGDEAHDAREERRRWTEMTQIEKERDT